jgi:Na+/melibiose symporter-like transporter
MELTDDYNERSSLFGFKGFFQFLGYLLLAAMLIGMSIIFEDNQTLQVRGWEGGRVGGVDHLRGPH